ncbi:MAG: DNA-3-methyladenine glycosylase 2 family protein [Nitrosomonas sp.]|uniref:DNA-3-methyladenine glycosylase family protein n=1 Tax=Nitrosomonas sp. TaxID=42353 RepID=UPI0025653840|nr:DNA-3-methyladenine glycosylase [Nitrosomonas sp.]MBE7527461.1 DNA-3-methyladenine glycosylase 2 family protein [Burkholderiales bacterium]MCC6160939.1 DNA-3-methyladenine glycosylase 2 family protein [Nitrosomonas sp.]MDL1865672.1 DNA-3-methyladenine glycosylase 2 family protein [Betaproteobacteria bacterium PRO4]
MTLVFWEQAVNELSARDPVMYRIIQSYSDSLSEEKSDAFTTLARAIVGQQISVKAAASVWQKVTTSIPEISPEKLMVTETSLLRACGLSARKIDYLRDLSHHFLEGKLVAVNWHELDDETLIRRLIEVKGIGRWTAEMFLIFHLHRPDVLPLDDIGLQRAVSKHYNDSQPINKHGIRAIAENWQPWRSVATWYLWRSLDPIPVIY